MSQTVGQLPHYRKPPVIEVVLGVQFEELGGFLSVHFGRLWERVKSEYSETQDKPPLPVLFENKPSQEQAVEYLDIPPLRRVFFVHKSGNYLLQVQPNRFLHNWRQAEATDEYPRFSAAEERFLHNWNAFREFVTEHKLGDLKVNQYELTYINHIVGGEKGFPRELEEYSYIFNWPHQRPNQFLPDPAALAISLKFELPEKRGRLHVDVKHGRRLSDNQEALIIELTARGPSQSDASDMESWFALAHEWIVRGFTDLTKPAAHDRWGRIK